MTRSPIDSSRAFSKARTFSLRARTRERSPFPRRTIPNSYRDHFGRTSYSYIEGLPEACWPTGVHLIQEKFV